MPYGAIIEKRSTISVAERWRRFPPGCLIEIAQSIGRLSAVRAPDTRMRTFCRDEWLDVYWLVCGGYAACR
jgi:hypothetical protein